MSFDPKSPGPYFDGPKPPAYPLPPPPPQSFNTLLYVLLGMAGIFFVGCAGCAGLTWYAATTSVKMASAGMQMVAAAVGKQVTPQLQADPVIQQHIGNISEVEMSISDAVNELGKNPDRHKGRDLCFKIKGDKGQGLIMCRLDQSDSNQPRVVNGELNLPDGEFHPLSGPGQR